MKNAFKRTLAILLTVVMLMSIAPISVFAKGDEAVSKAETDAQFADDTGMGKIINNLTPTDGGATNTNYVISDVVVKANVATVKLTVASACKLVVAIYDEETQQMLAYGMTDVAATEGTNDSEVSVAINKSDMPSYYLVKAFLVDDNYAALTGSYSYFEYTEMYERFMETTPEDFDQDRVVSLSENNGDEQQDFGALNKDVVKSDIKDGSMSISYNAETAIYTFLNATDDVKSLKVGDVYFCQLSDEFDDFILLKVKSINVSGSTVKISEDIDISLEDAFDYVRIDEEADFSDISNDDVELGNCVDFADAPETQSVADGEILTTQSDEEYGDEQSEKTLYSNSFEISYPKEASDDESAWSKGIKMSGTIGYSLKAAVRLHWDVRLGPDYYEFKTEIKNTLDLTFNVTGTIKLNTDKVCWNIAGDKGIPISVFRLYIKVYPIVEVSASIDILRVNIISVTSTNVNSSDGYNKDSKVVKSVKDSKVAESEISVKVGIGVEFEFGRKVGKKDNNGKEKIIAAVSASVEGYFSITLTPFNLIHTMLNVHHECVYCATGTLNGTVEGSLELKIKLFKIVDFTPELAKIGKTWTLGTAYFSISSKGIKFGMGDCPYIQKGVSVIIKDNVTDGNPLKDVSVSAATGFCCADNDNKYDDHKILTGDDGTVKFYFSVGNHTLTAEYNGQTVSKDVNITEIDKEITIYLDISSVDSPNDETGSNDSVFTGTEATGTVINFGSYPQSKVTDSATISALDGVTKNWKSYNYYSGTGNEADGNMTSSDYMKYADIKLGGNKYRAVTFNEYRPKYTGYTSSASNSYQDENEYYTNNVYYFKYDPLKWRVLDASKGLIVCDSAIDSQPYNNYVLYINGYWGDSNKNYYASNWEYSSLRAWLNNEFYNTAFSEMQQDRIKELTRENKSTYDSEDDSNPTSDKITLLSYVDVLNKNYGFNSSSTVYDTARQRKGTDYAKCQGLYVYNDNSWWRLRSPYGFHRTAGVNSDGQEGSNGFNYYVYFTSGGIVPALNLSVSSSASDGTGSNDSVFTGTEATGTIINFGSYPQSRVNDTVTINNLDGVTKNWKSYNYYSGTGDTDDGNMEPSDFMLYADFKYNGDKYRAVTFSEYRPNKTGYTLSAGDSEQDDNGFYLNNVYYFKYEPLKWRILDASEGLIMCENIIDSQAYNNFIYYDGYSYYNSMDCKNYISNWETSSLRKWLSEDFYYTAFSKSQQSRILTSHNENKSTYLSDFDGTETDDKVFLLSYWEVLNPKYGFDSWVFANDKARMLQGTDYAKCQGLYVCKDVDLLNNSWLRLRSPGDSSFATEVSHDGWVNYVYDYYDTTGGIAPVLRIEKSPITTSSILSSEIAADDAVVEVTSKTIKTAQTVSAAIANGEFTLGSANDGGLYMVYGVTDYDDGFTLSADNLVYIDQSEGKDGKVTLSYKPSRTDNATVIVVGDFGSGIEARKVELKTGYTVTWNIDGNTVTQTYAPGDKLAPPTVPAKDGYDFKGWDNTVPSTMPDKDLTFTAVYEKVSERKTVKAVSIDDISLNYKKSAYLNPNITADEGAKYTVTYYSSNTKVAKVDENGKVTATKKGSGNATITCAVTDEYGNTVTDTCTVKVSLNFGQILLVYVLFGWIWY